MLIFPWYFSVFISFLFACAKHFFVALGFPSCSVLRLVPCNISSSLFSLIFIEICNCLCTENMCCCGFSFSLSFSGCVSFDAFSLCAVSLWLQNIRKSTDYPIEFDYISCEFDACTSIRSQKCSFRILFVCFEVDFPHLFFSSSAAVVAFVRCFLVCIAILLCDGCKFFV